jgi:hypothetical protein
VSHLGFYLFYFHLDQKKSGVAQLTSTHPSPADRSKKKLHTGPARSDLLRYKIGRKSHVDVPTRSDSLDDSPVLAGRERSRQRRAPPRYGRPPRPRLATPHMVISACHTILSRCIPAGRTHQPADSRAQSSLPPAAS